MDVEFFRAGLDLKIISQRIQTSLEEIKEKSPNRKEYIKPMTESINQLKDVMLFLKQVESVLEISRQRNVDLENLNLIRLKEIEELKNKIKFNNFEL